MLYATKLIGSGGKLFIMSEDLKHIKKMQFDNNPIFIIQSVEILKDEDTNDKN